MVRFGCSPQSMGAYDTTFRENYNSWDSIEERKNKQSRIRTKKQQQIMALEYDQLGKRLSFTLIDLRIQFCSSQKLSESIQLTVERMKCEQRSSITANG